MPNNIGSISITDRSLFSHILEETLDKIDKNEQEIEDNFLQMFSEKMSLSEKFIDELKNYIECHAATGALSDKGVELYARILSVEKFKDNKENSNHVSCEEAGALLYKKETRTRRYSYAAIPKAIEKSFVLKNVPLTQNLFDNWIVLTSVFVKVGTNYSNTEAVAVSHANASFEAMRIRSYKDSGFHKIKIGKDSNSNSTASNITAFKKTNLDDFYYFYQERFSKEIDVWSSSLGFIQKEDEVKQTAYEKIQELVGHQELKDLATELVEIHEVGLAGLKKKFLNASDTSLTKSGNHVALLGNPGTGKTTVARLLGELFYDSGLLSKGTVIEVSSSDLIAGYVGHTATQTKELIDKSKGGVLFIDEAYKLYDASGSEFASEAVAELIIAMENENDLIIVFAGYNEPMLSFLKSNEGLPSRIKHKIECDDFNIGELMEILGVQLENLDHSMDDDAYNLFETKMAEQKEITPVEYWGNGRFVRDCLSDVLAKQSHRLSISGDLNYVDYNDEGKMRSILRQITIADVELTDFSTLSMLDVENKPRNQMGFRLVNG